MDTGAFSSSVFNLIDTGNRTPGLLLFSAPGKGASRVPLPAVWYNAALCVPAANNPGRSMLGSICDTAC
jgi:hypothetical protein